MTVRELAIVPSILSMEPSSLYSRLTVPIGWILMVSKVIRSSVCLFFLFHFLNQIISIHLGQRADTSPKIIFIESSQSIIQLRVPPHTNLIVSIRDTFDGVTEYALQPIHIVSDEFIFENFIDELQRMGPDLSNNPIYRALTSIDPEIVGQMLFSLSRILDEKNDQFIHRGMQSKTLNYPKR